MKSEKTAAAAAVKAKETALEKMRNGDFSGARELAVEARKLCPAMDSLDQMILVCNVHCSAAEGGGAGCKDWYKILDVAAAADEAAVRSRCGRMALGLHPDRNKLPGAAEVFQLIVEAKAVLVDGEKRRVYDSMCRAKAMGEEQWGFGFSRFRNDEKISNGFARFRGVNDQVSSEIWPNGGGGRGSELNEPSSVKLNTGASKVSVDEEVGISDFGFSRFINSVHNSEGLNWGNGFSRLHNGGGGAENGPNGSRGRGGGRGRGRGRGSKLNEPSSGKQNVVEEKDATTTITKVLDGDKVNFDFSRFQNAHKTPNLENGSPIQPKRPRGRPRGSRGRGRGRGGGRGSSTNVDVSGHHEGEIACAAPKQSRKSGSCTAETHEEEADQNSKRATASASAIRPDSEILEYTDAEFNDFEQERSRACFEAGQIWAVYDTLDAMPRFYAMINTISHDHKLQITWLEPLPNDDNERKWLYQGLPASFGKFKNGYTEMIQDYAVFSHLVQWKRDAFMRKNYEIRPQKGETWAVFKNWDIKWECNPQRIGGFEYEVVEILSDYFSEFGVNVAYLGKIEGFCCVFGRRVGKGVDWEVIKAKDRLRFSHRIPSFSVSVDGPNGVESFFELDPASLPLSILV